MSAPWADVSGLIASVLWTSLVTSLVGAVVGAAGVTRGRRASGFGLLLASTLALLAFSFAAGFTIGRFTAAIPVLLIGLMLSLGRGRLVVLLAVVTAAGVYVACSWLLTGRVVEGKLPAWLFGAWAIPFDALLALGAFGLAVGGHSARGRQASR